MTANDVDLAQMGGKDIVLLVCRCQLELAQRLHSLPNAKAILLAIAHDKPVHEEVIPA